ncbi:MAG: SusC/RagA family TonB-linked outer membrane protein [Flavobacteriaceae bacterium]|nr:SusC/RagA family TonB-linked outer membrane protein [Flavobacteriaceae bacterium]
MKKEFNGILTLLLALIVQVTFAQEKQISGTVSDETGPLPGVSVIIKGTTTGAETNFDGVYQITAKPGDVLVFSYIGMDQKSITIGNSNTINVTLTGGNMLDKVVIIGYGKQSRENITSSLTSIDAKSIEGRATASIVQALQAKAPGLNISTSNGQPGGASQILLRGINSISGNVEPLFIMDGIPIDEDNFRSINQADIATITVLKDASATAIYGNRATGGVIIMTSKKGTINQKTTVQYTGKSGYTYAPKPTIKLLNSSQLLTLERLQKVGTGGGKANDYVSEVIGVPSGNAFTDEQIAQVAKTNVNWADALLRTGTTISHNLSFTSGSENSTSFTSLGYFEQEGITLRSSLQRFNFRNNLTYTKNKFKLSTTFSAGFSRSNLAGGIGTDSASGSLSNPFLTPYLAKPYLSPYNADGSLNIIGNPDYDEAAGFLNTPYVALNTAKLDIDRETEIKILASTNATYNFTDHLSSKISVGIDFTEELSKFIQPTNSIRGSQSNKDAEFKGAQFEGIRRDTRMNTLAGLTYINTFGDVNNFSISAFSEFLYSEYQEFSYHQVGLIPGLEGTGAGFVPGETTEDPNNDGIKDYYYIPTLGSFKSNVSQFSYFTRLTYNYDNIAGLDLTVRRDASSRFNKTNKWGTFWATGAFWNLKKSVLNESKLISTFKLRASYGLTGNDRVSNKYYDGLSIPFDLYNTGSGYNGSVSLYASQLGNPNLKWETTKKSNIGIDFGLFNQKITGSFDVYSNKTTDVFINRPNTGVSGGFTGIKDNVGSLTNKGLEAQLTYDLINNDKFFWSISANGSYNKNEITSLPGTEADINGNIILNAENRAIVSVGHTYNSYYLVRWAGVNPANGKPLYLDREGNITEEYSLNNRVIMDKSSSPTYQGGFSTSIQYKAFSLDANFSFTADVYRMNGVLALTEDTNLLAFSNMSTTTLNSWKQPGDVTSYPSLKYSGGLRLNNTDRYLEDASYIRLKTLAIGYELTETVLKNTLFDSVKIYAQAENLLTWTKWKGMDPEFSPYDTNDFFSYPNSQIFTFGVDIKL